MKRTQVFEANDGSKFDTIEACKAHESNRSLEILIGLSLNDVVEALDRTNILLSDAFERVGNMIAEKRRKSGDLKRTKSDPTRKQVRDTSIAVKKADGETGAAKPSGKPTW